MSDLMKRVILSKYPDYDINRYHFKFGDIVETNNKSKVFIVESAIDYVNCLVLKSGFGLKKGEVARVPYTDLPYFDTNCFINQEYCVSRKLIWRIGDFVKDPKNDYVLLLKEKRELGGFYAYVIECENPYYTETVVYIPDPYVDYTRIQRR